MSARLREGKVPWEVVARHLGGSLPPAVLLGPGHGEDAALVEIGGEVWAVASDPISLAASGAGRLAVLINANDVAAVGGAPRFFTAVVLLAPEAATEGAVEGLLGEIRRACHELGVALIGGHTEVTPGLTQSLVVGTMLGPVARPLTTSGLAPGHWIGLTKWAGLEGTSILLADFGDRFTARHGAGAFLHRHELTAGDWLSVVPEATAAAAVGEVSALHDVTEGGVGEALHELASASGCSLEVSPEAIPVLAETRLLCRDLGLDPLGLLGSGALLVGCEERGKEALAASLASREIPFTWIGRAREPGAGTASAPPRFPRDELVKAYLLAGIEAVIFDLDGTLVDSRYDWPAIRRQLGVTQPSIIDSLNGLASPEREEKWRQLEATEARATEEAEPKEGAGELLALLRRRGLRTALVTNNSAANARRLLERFQLSFDAVVTRDDGAWKPSAAPLEEAMRRLGTEPGRTLAVGDSHLDVAAAEAAGCRRICLLHDSEGSVSAEVDLRFPHIPAFTRYLEIVLPRHPPG